MNGRSWLTLALLGSTLATAAAAAPRRIAVLNLETSGVAAALSESATALIPTEIRRAVPGAEVLSPDEVTGIIGARRQRELSGGEGSSGMKELGRTLSADEVVSGRLGALGATVVVELHRIETAKAHVIRSATRTVDANGAAVVEAIHSLVAELYGLAFDSPELLARRTRGAVFGGVGLVVLAAGVVGIVHVQSDASAYTRAQGHPELATVTRAGAATDQWLWPASIGVAAVGLAGVIYGGIELFGKPPDVVPSVEILPSGGALTLSGRFE